MTQKTSRNDPCPCGSNKKYKQCCLKKNAPTARYTPEGKYKFSAEVISSNHPQNSCSQLFQRLSENLSADQQQAINKYHEITKNKVAVGKKAIRKAQAKEDRAIAKELQKHSFQVMDADLPESHSNDQISQNADSLSEEVFIPTNKDYRLSKNIDSNLEENQQ